MRKSHLEIKDDSPKYYLKVEMYEHCEVTEEANPDNEWDSDDLYYHYTIEGFTVVDDEKKGWDFILDEDPADNTYYLVCAFYDTGDSFHKEENRICLVSLQKYIEDAEAIVKAIQVDYDEKERDNHRFDPIQVKLPKSGKTETIGTSTWKGYFESLREVRVEFLHRAGLRVKFNRW